MRKSRLLLRMTSFMHLIDQLRTNQSKCVRFCLSYKHFCQLMWVITNEYITLPSFFWYRGRVDSVIGPTVAPNDFSCLARSPSDKAATSNGRSPLTLLLMTTFLGSLTGSFCKIKLMKKLNLFHEITTSDQDRISCCNISIISSRQVMRIKKNIN